MTPATTAVTIMMVDSAERGGGAGAGRAPEPNLPSRW